MSAWLRRQNKPELQELAEKSGMSGNIHTLTKPDLVENLDLHLSAASQRVRDDPAFASYYESHNRSSPAGKREPNSSAPRATASPEPPKTDKRISKRRQTIVGSAAESANDAAERAVETTKKGATRVKKNSEGLMAKTPHSLRKFAASVPLPSSPQAVTTLITRQSERFNASVSNALQRSGLPNATESTRTMLGGVQAITTLFTLFEAFALNRALIPFRHAFTLSIPFLGNLSIKFPDLFVLLTSAFWGPVFLWSIIALFVPVAVGWLFNISKTQSSAQKYAYGVDPVVFNVAKAVALWVFYVRGWDGRDQWADPRTSGTVDGAVIGGVPAMFLGSVVAGGLGVWEGVVRGQR